MGDDTVQAARHREQVRRKADRMAVKIVSLVVEKVENDGTLPAYDGIEVARAIRELIVEAFG